MIFSDKDSGERSVPLLPLGCTDRESPRRARRTFGAFFHSALPYAAEIDFGAKNIRVKHAGPDDSRNNSNGRNKDPVIVEKEDERPTPASLLKNLSESQRRFSYVRQRRNNTRVAPPPCVMPSFLSYLTVNFIDPTTTTV